MSYNQIDWLQQPRGSIDSQFNRNSVRMSVDSCMRPSTDDAASMQIVYDALSLRIGKLGEVNTRIRKQILKFENLSDTQRKEVR